MSGSARHRTPPATPRRWFFWLVPIFASLLTVGVAELLLALFWPVPFASESNMYYIADEELGYRLKPDSVGWFPAAGEPGRTNQHGLRDDDFPARKPPGELRILVIGDSFTMGAEVSQDATYPQVLETLLAKRLGSPVQVMNAGVGGWGPFHYFRYLEHYGLALEPDVVVVGFFVGNDTYDTVGSVEESRVAIHGRRVNRESIRQAPASTRRKLVLYASSHLARRYFNRNLFVVSADELGGEGEPRDGGRFPKRYLAIQARKARTVHARAVAREPERAANAVRQIAGLKRLADAWSLPLLVVLIPDENQVNRSLARRVVGGRDEWKKYDFSMPQPLLIESFREHGIETLDLLPSFLADPRRLYMNDSHWSEAGHRLAAEAIQGRVAALAR